jgi:glycosyltransferase involved in cell wall biosynthesis
MVTVSVLMTSYNHEKYLREAIESVLNQTFKDFELIIVDDGSYDNSPKIIEEYAKHDKRIRAYFHENNKGIPKTGNHCLARATGTYIAFISSDDIWSPSKLEKQLAILSNNDSLVVWSEGEIIDENSIPTGKTFTERASALRRKKSGNIFQELLKANFILGPSSILKRELTEGITFDERLRYLNDYKFMMDLAFRHHFFFVKEALVKYRVHSGSTFEARKTCWADLIILHKYFLQKYGAEIPQEIKVHLLSSIGWAYLQLNGDLKAKPFFLEVIKTHPSPLVTLRFLICYLTVDKSHLQVSLLETLETVDKLLSRLRISRKR